MSWYNFTGPVQGGDLPDDDERRRRRLHHADAGVSFAMGNIPGKGPQQSAGQQQMVLEQAPGGAAGAVQHAAQQGLHAPRMGAAVDFGQGAVQPSSSPTSQQNVSEKRGAEAVETQDDLASQRRLAGQYFDEPVKPMPPPGGDPSGPSKGPSVDDSPPGPFQPAQRGDDVVFDRSRRGRSPAPAVFQPRRPRGGGGGGPPGGGPPSGGWRRWRPPRWRWRPTRRWRRQEAGPI